MTEPMRVTGPRATTTPTPTAAAAPTAPPPDPSQVADAAAGDVARLQAARPSALRRATAGDLARAANGVAQAYVYTHGEPNIIGQVMMESYCACARPLSHVTHRASTDRTL